MLIEISAQIVHHVWLKVLEAQQENNSQDHHNHHREVHIGIELIAFLWK